MADPMSLWKSRTLWVALVGFAALGFWVVGLGAGMRGWILTDGERGIVAHAQGFGEMAFIWWTPATIITLTTVVMALGISLVRHLVDGPAPIEDTGPSSVSREPQPAVPILESPSDETSSDIYDKPVARGDQAQVDDDDKESEDAPGFIVEPTEVDET